MNILTKIKFSPGLFMAVSLMAFFLLGVLYFGLYVNAFFNEIARQNVMAEIAEQELGETCVSEEDFDISDPYVTKAPGWKKE